MHIALITSGLTGIVNASFELAIRLEREGHQITYLCPQPIEEKVTLQGFRYFQLPEIKFNYSPINHDNNQLRFGFIRSLLKKGRDGERTLKALKLPEYAKALSGIQPDVALIDQELHEVILAALSINIHVVLLNQWFCLQRLKGLPPIRFSIIPGEGVLGTSIGIRLAWLFMQLKIKGRHLLNRLTSRHYRKIALMGYALELGIPKEHLESRNFPSPFIFTSLPMLSMTLPDLDFPFNVPTQFNYLGPMVSEHRKEIPNNLVIQKKLAQLIQLKKEKNRTLLYCSVTSMAESDTSFIRKIMQAVALSEKWLLAVGLGGKIQPSFFSNVPENVYLFEWMPQMEILKEADCSINHGGIHTINECIHFAVPMVVYSGKKYDQNGCAARVHFHEIGIMGDKDRDDSFQICKTIQRVLEQPKFRANVEKMQKRYQKLKKVPIGSFIQRN